jgi:hypothetical protein
MRSRSWTIAIANSLISWSALIVYLYRSTHIVFGRAHRAVNVNSWIVCPLEPESS